MVVDDVVDVVDVDVVDGDQRCDRKLSEMERGIAVPRIAETRDTSSCHVTRGEQGSHVMRGVGGTRHLRGRAQGGQGRDTRTRGGQGRDTRTRGLWLWVFCYFRLLG